MTGVQVAPTQHEYQHGARTRTLRSFTATAIPCG